MSIIPVSKPPFRLLFLKDGNSLSVQASKHHYCTPRQDKGPYSHVEVGFPTKRYESLMPYAEDPSAPTETVYGWVPVEVVEQIILESGGLDLSGTL